MDLTLKDIPYKSNVTYNGLKYRYDGIAKVTYQKIESFVFTCLDERHEYKGHKRNFPVYPINKQNKVILINNEYQIK